jgi:hypothetical protein
MNKQELIERIECLKNIFGNKNEYVKIDMVVELLSELDEPQKVIIPQFVADWIEECEEKEKTLLNSLLYTPEGVNSWVGNSDNQELFARAWIEGYEVEKEKRYTIRFKNIRKETRYLKYDRVVENWYFGVEQCSKETKISHTRKELEGAGFGWVFDCEGIEVKEVEE